MTLIEEGAAPVAPVTFDDDDLLEVRPEVRGLAGRTLTMRRPSVRFLIAMRRGGLTDEVLWDEVTDAILTHDLGREPDRLTAKQILAIGVAWIEAMKDAAVPPASGTD